MHWWLRLRRTLRLHGLLLLHLGMVPHMGMGVQVHGRRLFRHRLLHALVVASHRQQLLRAQALLNNTTSNLTQCMAKVDERGVLELLLWECGDQPFTKYTWFDPLPNIFLVKRNVP